jgi:hypothetical protein
MKCFISGTLMTSIDAHGFSVSILRLSGQPKWLECLLGTFLNLITKFSMELFYLSPSLCNFKALVLL